MSGVDENVTRMNEYRKKVMARRGEEAGSDPGGGRPAGGRREHGRTGDGDGEQLDNDFVIQCLRSNELGDGVLYSTVNRGRFVFNKQGKEWLKWVGHHWEYDEMDECLVAVEQVVDEYMRVYSELYTGLKDARESGDKDEESRIGKIRSEILSRVKRLRSENGRNKCLICAHTNADPVAIRGDEIDRDPWLLPCANGVLDLRTGQMSQGRPGDYLLKASSVAWPEEGIDSRADSWERFLLEIMDNDEEMVAYLRRVFGYSITGLAREHVFVVLHGQGRNGKGTLVEMLSEVLGDMAGPIPSEMLLDQGAGRSAAGPSPDIMALRGLRLAFASETDENRKFSPSRVKWFSGGDSLTGRYPHDKRLVTFNPSHQLFLLTNEKPHAPAQDFAFWERLQLVPFELSFVDREPTAENERRMDKGLMDRLREEKSAILAWLVRGCLEWQQQGLNPPVKVQEATNEYRRDEDLLADFLDQCCLEGPQVRVKASDIYDVFVWWFKRNVSARKTIPQKTFGKLMGKRFEREKSGVYWYRGVGILEAIRDEMKQYG